MVQALGILMLLESVLSPSRGHVVDLLRHLRWVHVGDLVHRQGKTLHHTHPVHPCVVRIFGRKHQFFGSPVDTVDGLENRGLARTRLSAKQVEQEPIKRSELHEQRAKPHEESKRPVLHTLPAISIDDILPNVEVALGLEQWNKW